MKGKLSMWEKHKKELLVFAFMPVVVVILLLILVSVFEYFEIHVSGSREMWIGLIGAVLGGTFTLFGVMFTVFKQEYSESEQKRLQNLPILGFDLCTGIDDADCILTYTKDGLITSGFPNFERMEVKCIKIRTANNMPVFNFTIEGCAVNGKEILLSDAFNPSKSRIVPGESTTFIFNYSENLRMNIFCLVRFSYEDIFGNRYYQDFPFNYIESVIPVKNRMRRQIIDIRDIKQPIYVKKEGKTLEQAAEEYEDYKFFCNN